MTFERGNVKGRAFGALVRIPEKRLELHRDVFFETLGGTPDAPSSVKYAKVESGSATYDQITEKVELHTSVKVFAETSNGSTDITARDANVFLVTDGSGSRDANKIELFGDVSIKASQEGKSPIDISSAYVLFEKDADRFTLKENVDIVSSESGKPLNISASSAIYEHGGGKVFLEGGAQVTQAADFIRGDRIDAELTSENSLKSASSQGNAYLKQVTPDRTTEISAAELYASFGNGQNLTDAKAVRDVRVLLLPVNVVDYAKVTLSAPSEARVMFKSPGRIEKMETEGRTSIDLEAPDNVSDAANKRVTADRVRAIFSGDGSALS